MAVNRMFDLARKGNGYKFHMSFYEIYGGRVFDLLGNHKRVQILEDGNNFVSKFSKNSTKRTEDAGVREKESLYSISNLYLRLIVI